jgi:DNA-binding NarL/FixJ family response regulator
MVQERRRLLREGLARVLPDLDRSIEVVAVAAGAGAVLANVAARKVDLAVVELEPPDRDFEELVAELAARAPACRIAALHHGRRSDHDVVAGPRVVLVPYAGGRRALASALRGRPLPSRPGELPERRSSPSRVDFDARERELLELLASGATAEMTARRTGATAVAVEHRRRALFAKLGVTTAAQAVAMGAHIGLLDAP